MMKGATEHLVVVSENLPSGTQIRKWFRLAAFALTFAMCGAVAQAQQSAKMSQVGFILTSRPEEIAHLAKSFEDGLQVLGYVEGRNIVLDRRYANGRQERLPSLAAELVRMKPDVIVSGANPVIAALKQATRTIPIVMAVSRDPEGAGFIAIVSAINNLTYIECDRKLYA